MSNYSYIWYLHDSLWNQGEVIQWEGEQLQVRNLENNTSLFLDKTQIERCNNHSLETILELHNLINLVHLHEPAILHHTYTRYQQDMIYTNTGDILLAINPFKKLPIYEEGLIRDYYESKTKKTELGPHVFGVAQAAYSQLHQGDNQSILVSGESGAGKTVSAKYVMKYLAHVGSDFNLTQGEIEDKILSSNPILEAFGNAKTLRNDNSSRFGKYIKLFFRRGKLIGSKIETYLLEQVRIVSPSQDERNFHIFYMLLQGLTPVELESLYLNTNNYYRFLDTNCQQRNDGILDSKEFSIWKNAMYTMGFSELELTEIYRNIAVVLLLGNLSVSEESDTIYIHSLNQDYTHTEVLENICKLLDLEVDIFLQKTMYKTINTMNETYHKPLSLSEITSGLEGLAKSIYSNLFHFIVQRINNSLDSNNKHSETTKQQNMEINKQLKFIGILDIFGFEVFQENNFEQLCINFTNEMLQQQFNHYVFAKEQEEYRNEEIDWSHISFPDNNENIDAFMKKPFGIFHLLDETCKLRGTDQNFYNRLVKQHTQQDVIQYTSRMKGFQKFAVNHYAGNVTYSTHNFIHKNTDLLTSDIWELYTKIPMNIWKDIRKIIDSRHKLSERNSVSYKTISEEFRLQLNNLMQVILQTQPHYIRCLKPNDSNRCHDFNKLRILEQLRYAGVLEAIKIARLGYAIRFKFGDFLCKYHNLFRLNSNTDPKQQSQEILELTQTSKMDAQLGKTKVFLKKKVYNSLEKLLLQTLNKATIKIQTYYRRFQAQRNFRKTIRQIIILQNLYRKKVALQCYLFLKKEKSATIIQTQIRRKLNYTKYQRILSAIIKIQSVFRKYPIRKYYLHYVSVTRAIQIQSQIRKLISQKRWKSLKIMCIRVQNWWRQQRSFQILVQKKQEARDINHLKSHIRELQQQKQEQEHTKISEISLEKYQQQIETLQKETQELEKETQGLQTENQGLQTENQGLQTENQGLQTENQGLEKETQENVKTLEILQQKIETSETKNIELSLFAVNIQEKSRNFEKQLEEETQKAHQSKKQLQQQLIITEETNGQLLSKIQTLQDSLSLHLNKETNSIATQTQQKLRNTNIQMNDSNNFSNTIENRTSKNRIESSYLVIDKYKREKTIKKLEKQYHKSLDAVHRQLQQRDGEINILQHKLDDALFKINSMESILIAENQIKRELLVKLKESNVSV